MAWTAQQPVIIETAFATAVGDRDDVIRLPERPHSPPALSCRTVRRGRFRPRPFAMGLDHIQTAQSADTFVALLDLTPHVPGAAADLPLVHARLAAERPPRRDHRAPAPSADRLPHFVPIRLTPLIRRHRPRPPDAHSRLIGGDFEQV